LIAILCAGMVAEVLASISDVTDRVTAAVAGKTGDEFIKARDAQIAAVEKEGCAGKEDGYSCQVVTMYQGGQYKLYKYRKYTDVRSRRYGIVRRLYYNRDNNEFA
jgi:Peptidase S46